MSPTFSPPPVLPPVPLPEYILHVAQAYPDREVVCFLQDADVETDATTTSVTWRQFLADVWERADYFVEVTGLEPRTLGKERVVVGLLAESTYDFLVDLVAIFILRWQALLISIRNSPDAIVHLMRTTGCRAVLVDSAISHLHTDILRADKKTGVTPTVIGRAPPPCDATRDGLTRAAEFLARSSAIPAQALKKEAEGGAFFLHTSGSTGHPKPIAWSHEFVLALSAANWRDRARCADDVLYTCFPMFHAGGICTSFPFFLGSGASFVCLDTWRSVSVDTILRHLRILKRHGRKVDASLPPSMLEDIADADDVDGVGVLAAQNTVFWGGAPLRENAGNYLVKHGVRLVAWGGSTEAGPLARSSYEDGADPMDWQYMRLVDYYEFHWYPMKGDPHERYNLIVSPIHATPPIVNSLDPLGFATVDGWQRHADPSKAHLWKPAGRLDDVTVLSNGEKTDNKQLEDLLCASRDIHHAIIFGAGRFVNGAIVEPPPGLLKADASEDAVERYLDEIWPHIDGHVNKIVPQHSRLLRGMVLVARPDRPFLLSDKGTVKTKSTLVLYAADIDRAYDALERGVDASTAHAHPALPLPPCAAAGAPADAEADAAAAAADRAPDDNGESAVLAFVQALLADALGRPLAPTDDFFRNGLDSLGATRVRTSLAAALRRAGVPAALPRNAVYAHPTPAALARFLVSLARASGRGERPAAHAHAEDAPVPPEAEIARMVETYTRDLPEHTGTGAREGSESVYAVTGTTGSLGAAYVAHLLRQDGVRKVYLLNRGHAARAMAERQEAAFGEKGLDCAALRAAAAAGRVEYVEIDVGKARLGMDEGTYTQLASELTHIVHNAWLLNFNLFLPSFEPHIAGVRAVLDLALSSTLAEPPHVAFVSSIGAVGRWPFAARPVPEAALNSPEFCIPQGYSYSKYVSEQILQRAVALRPALRATVVRCGQLSGALTTGAWARSEYIPRLLRSAVEVGMVPTGLKPVRWLPVDVAANILFREVEHAAAQTHPGPLLYYSLDNALATPWERVAAALKVVRADTPLREVPLREFLDAVRKDTGSAAYEVAEHLEDLLAARPVPPLATTRARAAVGALVDCELGEELLRSYVRYACA